MAAAMFAALSGAIRCAANASAFDFDDDSKLDYVSLSLASDTALVLTSITSLLTRRSVHSTPNTATPRTRTDGNLEEILFGFKAWMLPGPRQKESTIPLGSEKWKAP